MRRNPKLELRMRACHVPLTLSSRKSLVDDGLLNGRGILGDDGLAAEDAVLVAVFVDLVAEALGVEDVPADQTCHALAAFERVCANRAHVVVALVIDWRREPLVVSVGPRVADVKKIIQLDIELVTLRPVHGRRLIRHPRRSNAWNGNAPRYKA